jgi:hypothetical protein
MGGSFGVVKTSTITGRSAANASLNAPSIWSELVTLMPLRPMRSAHAA